MRTLIQPLASLTSRKVFKTQPDQDRFSEASSLGHNILCHDTLFQSTSCAFIRTREASPHKVVRSELKQPSAFRCDNLTDLGSGGRWLSRPLDTEVGRKITLHMIGKGGKTRARIHVHLP